MTTWGRGELDRTRGLFCVKGAPGSLPPGNQKKFTKKEVLIHFD